MSVRAVSWALDEVSGLHPTRKLVLIVMAEAAHADGTASFVSYNTISDKTGISRRQVIEHVKALHQAGYIKRGDQRHTAFLPLDRRPTVWDMNLTDTARLNAMLRGAVGRIPRGEAHNTPRGEAHNTTGVKTGVQPTSPKPETQELNHAAEVLCVGCDRSVLAAAVTESGLCVDCLPPHTRPVEAAVSAARGAAAVRAALAESKARLEATEAAQRAEADQRAGADYAARLTAARDGSNAPQTIGGASSTAPASPTSQRGDHRG